MGTRDDAAFSHFSDHIELIARADGQQVAVLATAGMDKRVRLWKAPEL